MKVIETLIQLESITKVFIASYPDQDQLQTVYGTYLQPVLHHSLSSHPVWGSTARVHALASSMVQVYEQVRLYVIHISTLYNKSKFSGS